MVATSIAAIVFFSTANVSAADYSAELFIRQAYAPWVNPALKRMSDTELMSPAFMKLWQADDAAAEKVGEIGMIEGNLICACEDGQMSALTLTIRPINASHATAHAVFLIDANPHDQYLVLKAEKGRWYIDDIIAKGKSLAAQLREDARMRLKHPVKLSH